MRSAISSVFQMAAVAFSTVSYHFAAAVRNRIAAKPDLLAAGSDRHPRELDHVLVGPRRGKPVHLEGMVLSECRQPRYRTAVGAEDALATDGAAWRATT